MSSQTPDDTVVYSVKMHGAKHVVKARVSFNVLTSRLYVL
jgi:hypothetical protein